MPYAIRLLSTFLGLALLLVSLSACAPDSSQGSGKQGESGSSNSNDLPEITDETIREKINGVYIRKVPEQNGENEPIRWAFDEEEPKELTVVEKQVDGGRATITLDIKTETVAGANPQRRLAGRIRTKWELEKGWVLRRWEIVDAENISMTYKNLPKLPAQNSNR